MFFDLENAVRIGFLESSLQPEMHGAGSVSPKNTALARTIR
jgi:hypothetical protein